MLGIVEYYSEVFVFFLVWLFFFDLASVGVEEGSVFTFEGREEGGALGSMGERWAWLFTFVIDGIDAGDEDLSSIIGILWG